MGLNVHINDHEVSTGLVFRAGVPKFQHWTSDKSTASTVRQVMYVVEGGFSMGQRQCGPGTVLFIEANTQYGFEVWDEGVRFLNIRQGLARYTVAGQQSIDPYETESATS